MTSTPVGNAYNTTSLHFTAFKKKFSNYAGEFTAFKSPAERKKYTLFCILNRKFRIV
jgi:hypothetical protein